MYDCCTHCGVGALYIYVGDRMRGLGIVWNAQNAPSAAEHFIKWPVGLLLLLAGKHGAWIYKCPTCQFESRLIIKFFMTVPFQGDVHGQVGVHRSSHEAHLCIILTFCRWLHVTECSAANSWSIPSLLHRMICFMLFPISVYVHVFFCRNCAHNRATCAQGCMHPSAQPDAHSFSRQLPHIHSVWLSVLPDLWPRTAGCSEALWLHTGTPGYRPPEVRIVAWLCVCMFVHVCVCVHGCPENILTSVAYIVWWLNNHRNLGIVKWNIKPGLFSLILLHV